MPTPEQYATAGQFRIRPSIVEINQRADKAAIMANALKGARILHASEPSPGQIEYVAREFSGVHQAVLDEFFEDRGGA